VSYTLECKTERIAFSWLALSSHYEKVYLTQTYWFPFLSIKKCWKSLKSWWVVAPKSAIVSWNWHVLSACFKRNFQVTYQACEKQNNNFVSYTLERKTELIVFSCLKLNSDNLLVIIALWNQQHIPTSKWTLFSKE